MKQKFLIGCVLLMAFMFCSCNSMMNYDLDNDIKKIDRQEKISNKSLSLREDPWDTIPSPIEWIIDKEGTGRYSPSDPMYFYVGEFPPYRIANEYSAYVYLDWHAFPNEVAAANYVMQIQWKWVGSEQWNYINTPMGHGLVNIVEDDLLEDMSAFAFPYLNSNESRGIQVRMRTIHKDFLKSAPNPDANEELENLYDRSLVSSWSADSRGGYMGQYSNAWGYGRPQPAQSGNNGSDEGQIDGHILVTVYLPTIEGYTFSYEISNSSGGYSENLRKASPSTTELNQHWMTGIGSDGGTITVLVKCTNKVTQDVRYSETIEHYSLGEKTLDIFFSEMDFL